jgi:hypothetical protein
MTLSITPASLPRPTTHAVVSFVLATCLSTQVFAIDYGDFPSHLQTVLDERIAELDSEGGTCLAGRVTFDDGGFISGGQDVMVNYLNGADSPATLYEGGWFISRKWSSYYAADNRRIVIRAFEYDPIDLFITILPDEITYLEVEMHRTPPAGTATITGIVTNEDDQPFHGASVGITFPLAWVAATGKPTRSVQSGPDGRFTFDSIASAEYRISAYSSDYASDSDVCTPPPGGICDVTRKLYPRRRIIFDYVYQPDGSRDFTGEGLQAGRIDWAVNEGAMNFSLGGIGLYAEGDSSDLHLRQVDDVLEFYTFFIGNGNGIYHPGAVPFDSITTAPESGYSYGSFPCLVGHVYVIETYWEEHYAKLIVQTAEPSFRTILAGDPAPIEFPGYGVTVDMVNVDEQGKLYAQMLSTSPGPEPTLPRYHALETNYGLEFEATVTIAYNDDELAEHDMAEGGLTLLYSDDGGETWRTIPAVVDSQNNTVTASDQDLLGMYAVGDVNRDSDGDLIPDLLDDCDDTPAGVLVDASGCALPIPGDTDEDLDVDQIDFGLLQRCLSGAGLEQPLVACEKAKLDTDNDVDSHDIALFLQCQSGSNVYGDPFCLQ